MELIPRTTRPVVSAAANALHGPRVQLVMAVLLVLTGGAEVVSPFVGTSDASTAAIGAHHGITIYGIYIFLMSLDKILKGSRDVHKGGRHVRAHVLGGGEAPDQKAAGSKDEAEE